MKPHKPDYILLFATLSLITFGIMIILSVSSVISQNKFGESYYYFRHQLLYGIAAGLFIWLIIQKINYKIWGRIAILLMFLSIVLLFLIFIPKIGYNYGGATRWINIGYLSIQPSEITKLTFIIYLAAWLGAKKKEIQSFAYGLLPFLLITGIISALIIFQPDIGTLGVIALTAMIIFFSAGAKIQHIILIIFGGFSGFYALVKTAPYRMERFTAFLHPEIDPKGIGYQINQALLAMGSGGLLGIGLGHSRQKYSFLPEPIGDSIFALAAEEIGFIGSIFLISIFLVFIFRGLKIAKNSPDKFGQLLAIGITSWIGIQVFINIAGISGLIPLTGITLPFISYGGSSMIMTLIGAGILLNISKYTNR